MKQLEKIDHLIAEIENQLAQLYEQRREKINRFDLNKVKDADKKQINSDRV
ncbi:MULTISPECIES: hypothetical protein [Orbaceae]|uniref:hypothetical protein n=1 Tax=Orbaceae TaxID=1240483 RepID=UPI0013027547|nr:MULTISPECIES: hypothetical protein [Orbaceae]MBI0037762.1 hypothetical protein [Gilliamella sp. B14384G10]MBI0039757.1 hypothetical protein [Gilliamella sp. B14384G7]MBI0051597.1 hypothetical protein [Gilliamella sp. B14384G13]MBI0054049.1 hypothetical protein [Gilliamella sp. B14384H2]